MKNVPDCGLEKEISILAEKLFFILKERELKLACAESCTAGLLSSSIAGVSGSSGVFAGSIIAYCNSAKIRLLGVDEGLLEKISPVSAECASAMAKGVIKAFPEAQIGVSTTGFFDANTPENLSHLAGRVFISVCAKNFDENALCELKLNPNASRKENAKKTVLEALHLLVSVVD